MKNDESEASSASAPALKEWAAIVSALGAGKQTITLRKGGIHEGKGGFGVKHEHFWLFPTGFHEHREKILPELAMMEEAASGDKIRLSYTAKVEVVRRLDSIDQVRRLHGFHFWQPAVIEDRFYQGKFEGLYLLLLRVFKVSQPAVIDYLPKYGGCRSWVDLPAGLPEKEISPSLSDKEFEVQKERILTEVKSED